jgi:hypothetical protein
MTVLREELEVDRPLDAVFDFVADFANAERWDPGVDSSRGLRGSRAGGSRYDYSCSTAGACR